MLKFVLPIVGILGVITLLVYSAVQESSKKVLTVAELVEQNLDQSRIRLGAKVSSPDIQIKGGTTKTISFLVKDPAKTGENDPQIKVVYHGLMPDTLKDTRDVILEGNYVVGVNDEMGVFNATTLNTQCPSKYEPPKPK